VINYRAFVKTSEPLQAMANMDQPFLALGDLDVPVLVFGYAKMDLDIRQL